MKHEEIDYRPLMSSSDEGIDGVEVMRPRLSLQLGVTLLCKQVLIAILVTQTLLNIVLIGSGFYLYSRRGPSNPIFPQLTYCKAQCLSHFLLTETLFCNSSRTGCALVQGSQIL